MTRRSKPKRKLRSDVGRRRKGPERLARMVTLRLTESQHAELELLAAESDSTAAIWARDAVVVALEAAAGVEVPPIPDGWQERMLERVGRDGVISPADTDTH